jgi:3D (Asp-Asp-Asp) domain-containing protein
MVAINMMTLTRMEQVFYAAVVVILLLLIAQNQMIYREITKSMEETAELLEAHNAGLVQVYTQQQQDTAVLQEILSMGRIPTVTASITAYTLDPKETDSTPNQTAIMATPKAGKTAAVSPDLSYLLGKKVYIAGHGVKVINDLTAVGIENTVDLLVGNKKQAKDIGRSMRKVVIL